MIQAQRIALTNAAWVILDCSVSAGPYRLSASSHLLRGDSATVDLAGLPWPEGAVVLPVVEVEADIRHSPRRLRSRCSSR